MKESILRDVYIDLNGEPYRKFKSGMKWINGSIGRDGYKRITSMTNGVRTTVSLHRLVALLYIPNHDNKPQVDHIDGNKTNNRIYNLRWCTDDENQMFRNEQGNDGGEYGVLGLNNSPIPIIYNGIKYKSKNYLAEVLSAERGVTKKCLIKTITATLKRKGTLYGKSISC